MSRPIILRVDGARPGPGPEEARWFSPSVVNRSYRGPNHEEVGRVFERKRGGAPRMGGSEKGRAVFLHRCACLQSKRRSRAA